MTCSITNSMHCTYTGRLLMQHMTAPPMCWRRGCYYAWNIFDTKAWRPFQFWRRSSVRNSLFFSPMLLWPL